MIMILDLSG